MLIFFKRLPHGEGLPLPAYATPGAAGIDICSAEDATIFAGERQLVSTGFAVEIPEGYELQVRPRSGLAAKFGVTVLNAPGTIDSDYRGEIKVNLINHGDRPADIARGDRIAQLVLAQAPQAVIEEREELSETERGAGGWGSTGR